MATAPQAPRPAKIYVFILLLQDRKFDVVGRISTHERSFESGDPVMWYGEEAVILGTGLTRSEAKANGTEYYNAVCQMHHEEGEWGFETQRFDEEQTQDSEAHEDGNPRKRRKTS